MCDLLARDGKEIMYVISNLKACCDRQLPSLGCLVEESVGVEREPAKLFAKILLVVNYITHASYRISTQKIGSETFKLVGIGQGNLVSGAICRNTFYLIFKKIEEMNLGIVVQLLLLLIKFILCTIAFVDNKDF